MHCFFSYWQNVFAGRIWPADRSLEILVYRIVKLKQGSPIFTTARGPDILRNVIVSGLLHYTKATHFSNILVFYWQTAVGMKWIRRPGLAYGLSFGDRWTKVNYDTVLGCLGDQSCPGLGRHHDHLGQSLACHRVLLHGPHCSTRPSWPTFRPIPVRLSFRRPPPFHLSNWIR